MKFWLADRDIIDGRSLYRRPEPRVQAKGLDAILIGFLATILIGVGVFAVLAGLFVMVALVRGFTGL